MKMFAPFWWGAFTEIARSSADRVLEMAADYANQAHRKQGIGG